MLVSTARDGLRELMEEWRLLQVPQEDSQVSGKCKEEFSTAVALLSALYGGEEE